MRWILPLFLLVACAPAPRPPAGPPPTLAITHVSVIPMDRSGVLADQTVLVRGDAIVAVAPARELAVPAGTPTLDGRGRYLIPGLFDTHVHLGNEPPEHLMLYLANGVTTVQNMSGKPAHLELRARVAAGTLPGPRILSTGPTTAEERVDSPDKARAHVAAVKAAGYDAIKQYGDGADSMSEETYRTLVDTAHAVGMRVVGHAPRNLPFTTVLAAGQDSIDHAEEIVYTHAPLGAGSIRAMQFSDPGPDKTRAILEELAGLVARARPAIGELANQSHAAGLALAPTLVAFETIRRTVSAEYQSMLGERELEYVSPVLRASWGPALNRYRSGGWRNRLPQIERVLATSLALQMEIVRAFDAAGVPLVTGTDAPLPFVYPGSSLHRELELFVAAGLTTEKALRAATVVAAHELRVPGGVVAAGAPADLVLLAANPLADIRNTRQIVAVVRAGRAWSRADLDAGLAKLAALYDPLELAVARIVERIDADDAAGVIVAFRATPAPIDPMLARLVENAVNAMGYKLLGANKLDAAIAAFELNTTAFPQSANTWDSLAEAYMTRGNAELAITNYQRSLELDPKNANAAKMIEKLRAQPKR